MYDGSVYTDGDDTILSPSTVSRQPTKLSTIVLRDNTTLRELDEYSARIQEELNVIENDMLKDVSFDSIKSHSKFTKIRVRLLNLLNKLKQLYVSYQDAKSSSSTNRSFSLRNQIQNTGLAISAIVSSYNRSGILVDGDNVIGTSSKYKSYENELKDKIIQNIQ